MNDIKSYTKNSKILSFNTSLIYQLSLVCEISIRPIIRHYKRV